MRKYNRAIQLLLDALFILHHFMDPNHKVEQLHLLLPQNRTLTVGSDDPLIDLPLHGQHSKIPKNHTLQLTSEASLNLVFGHTPQSPQGGRDKNQQ